MVRQGEAMFGASLLQMERGKGSKLTPLGEKLVWADHRIAARLSVLDSLASELEVEIERVVRAEPHCCASMPATASRSRSCSNGSKPGGSMSSASTCRARKRSRRSTTVAAISPGFTWPLGEFESRAFEHHSRWFDLEDFRVIGFATRRQGLIVAAGNPRKNLRGRRPSPARVRFIKPPARLGHAIPARQPAGGRRHRRFAHQRLPARRIHAQGVAAYVASGMADAGFGIETPARTSSSISCPSPTSATSCYAARKRWPARRSRR